MIRRAAFAFSVTVAAAVSLPALAAAAELPAIKASERNAVPACVTPGRLMAYIRSRNDRLDARFETIAVDYMRLGNELGMRWDYAFFQMAVETSYLTYKRAGNRRGDVSPTQNNFAGLGATGNGVSGESFKDVPTGVLAHLQHVLMYSGEEVENPVAERTRNVIKWGVLKSFHKKIKGPVTYSHLAQRWATSGEYDDAIDTHARRFFDDFCKKADPAPELLALVRPQPAKVAAVAPPPAPPAAAAAPEKPSGVELARRAIEEGRAEGVDKRLGLGGGGLLTRPAPAAEPAPAPAAPKMTLLNPATPEPAPVETPQAAPMKPRDAAKVDKPGKAPPVQVAAAPGPMATAKPAPAAPAPPALAPGAGCKVFTASYGGLKAILIRAPGDGAINYTVLDVNEGNEKREADAYITAYAKGGAIAGEFPSQTQALEKAFELCPEG